MIKTYSNKGELLNIICSPQDLGMSGRIDITLPEESLQFGMMQAQEDKSFKPHRHLDKYVEGPVHIVEAFVIIKGHGLIHIYDTDDTLLSTHVLKEGDVSLLLKGGHALEVREGCIFYEFKTGPYEGTQKDKVFI